MSDKTCNQIIDYIKDKTYNYAVLIDGEWGCGKTYFVKNTLTKKIEHHIQKESNDYISIFLILVLYNKVMC